MCTAMTYRTKDFYFGRTLDYDVSYAEEVVITPRNFPLAFRHMGVLEHHHAMIGMACVAKGYPLYFDGVNEKGLGMAGLNFVGNACYRDPAPGRDNAAQFEFIPWILSRCATVEEAEESLKNLRITGEQFHEKLPAAQLHWMIADRHRCITVEAVEEGLRVYPNPVGVLTNNPPFEEQLFHLNNFLHLCAREPENRFAPGLELEAYSRGMGALGLPGDLSSQSRFVRGAFVRCNSRSGEGEAESVGQFFHMLDAVSQPRGCCEVGQGQYEITRYSSCCNAHRGIYYYTTYGNRQITAVDMHREELDGNAMIRYPLVKKEQIFVQNRYKKYV